MLDGGRRRPKSNPAMKMVAQATQLSEPAIHGTQLRVVKLGSGGHEQRVGARHLLDDFVFASEMFAEVELLSISLEPDLLSIVRESE